MLDKHWGGGGHKFELPYCWGVPERNGVPALWESVRKIDNHNKVGLYKDYKSTDCCFYLVFTIIWAPVAICVTFCNDRSPEGRCLLHLLLYLFG